MGLFDKIFGFKKERELMPDSLFKMLNGYTPAFTNWNGSLYESELVRAAIHAKAEHISKMSVRVIGAARPVLQTKLKCAPNEFQTWSQFLYRLSTILDVSGRCAFIVPVIDRYGDTTGIYPVLPSMCDLVEYQGTPYLRYRFATGNVASIELSACGIMTKFQYQNDFWGEGNGALRQTMNLLDIQNQGIREGVKSAASFRFMAQLSNFSKSEDLVKERKRWTADNLSRDSGGLLLFPNTYSNIQQIAAKPFVVDAEQMKLINTNVYNYFGVNEKVMQNSATADELDAFYNGALEPFAIQLSEVLTKMLFTIREQNIGNRVIVASDRLQYMTAQTKIALIQTLSDRGMITINEGRELLNYPPIDGGDDMMPIRGEYYNGAKNTDTEGNADE